MSTTLQRPISRASLALVPLLAPSLAAQDPEADAPDFAEEATQVPRQMPGWLGSRPGNRDRFDNTFNPALGVVIDTVAEFASAEDRGDRYNRVRVRTVELNAASRIDPLGWGYVTAAFVDTGAEQEVELEEAAILFENLPDTFTLRAGRFLSDFGKWNSYHTHDKPFVNEDLVRGEFFGGPLFVTGVEAHHWFGLGEVPVRWSLGLHSDAIGDDHDGGLGGGGHGHGDSEYLFGRRGIDNWAATGRFTGQHDIGQNGYFQWGLSGFYAPGVIEFEEETLPGGGVREIRNELRNGVVAADLTYRNVDAAGRTADTVSMELWHQDGQFEDAASGALRSDGHNGLWGFYEHAFSPRWAAGVIGSWFEHADSADGGDFLAGGETGARRGGFLTWNISEYQRLRFSVLHTNPGIGQEDFVSFAIQWSAILGSHTHPLDW